jgi:hypothetical protein
VRGLYALLRGEPERALPDLELGGHPGAYALALLAAGDPQKAREVAHRGLQPGADGADLFAPDRWVLCTVRALAEAEIGDARAAAAVLAEDIAKAEQAGVSGMLLCALHEAGVRLAIESDDRAGYRAHMRKLGATYGRGTSGLRSRYEQLGAVARRVLITVPPPPPLVKTADAVRAADTRTQIEQGHTSTERIEQALRLLAGSVNAQKGYFFGMQRSGLRLAGGLGDGPPPEGIEDMLAFYLNAELESGSTLPRTVTGTYSASPDLVAWISDGQHLYFPVLLACTHEQRRVVAGVVVLALAAQTEPVIPDSLIESISEGLIAAGDVTFAHAAQ